MIKNLIFDIGNVLLSYRWLAMIMEYEPDRDKAKDVGFKMFEAPAWADSFDRGTVDKDGIIELLGKEYPEYKAHYEWILNHPEKMPLPRKAVWDKIIELKNKGYKIYYLSNYSKYLLDSHSEGVYLFDHMDGGIVSYEVHEIKPDRAIYEALLNKYNLKADECFFFDDKAENVEGGEKVGIKGYIVKSEEDLLSKLEEF